LQEIRVVSSTLVIPTSKVTILQKSEQYKQEIMTYIREINQQKKPIVIFGAGKGGWYIMKVLEHYGVSINALADNDHFKHGNYYNHSVYSPETIATKFPNAIIFVGIFKPSTADAIKKQLTNLKFCQIHYNLDAFLFIYLTIIAKRTCDKDVLAQSIHILFNSYSEGDNFYGYTKENNFISPFVTSVITQRCSLRCRDCGQRIPYYKTPVHFPVKSIINDLTQYAKAFDVVPEISLHGGEPFLHPELAKICREVAKIPNIVFINFITNGTILPKEETLRQLSNLGADIHQSDYGLYSKQQTSLFDACNKHNIYCDILHTHPHKMWTQPAPTKEHKRSIEDNNKIYKKCVSSTVCCQLMDGELHRCSFSMHASHQNLFPKPLNDFVALNNSNTTDKKLISQIRDLLNNDQALQACDFCDPANDIEVPPAIQLPTNNPHK